MARRPRAVLHARMLPLRRRPGTCLVVLTVLLAAGVGTSLAGRKVALLCPTGRFLVPEGPLVPGADPGTVEVVVVADPLVSLGSGCPAVRAKLKGTAKGTRVKVTWPACPRLAGKAVLKGVIHADCQAMDIVFRARRAQIKRSFVAPLSTCSQDETTRVNEVEPNNSPGKANLVAALPVNAQGAITPGADLDYFAIPVTAGTRLHLETFDANGVTCAGVDTYLELCDTDGVTLIASSDDDGLDACAKIAGPSLETGTYFARVLSLAQTPIPAYRLRISRLP